MTRSSPRSTTTIPTCPSALGTTTTISFVPGKSRTSARTAPSSATATSVHAHEELGSANAHYARGRAHAHRSRRLLDHLARHHRKRAFLQRGVEFPVVRRAVEFIALDREHGRGARGHHGVVQKGDAHRAVGARHQRVGAAHRHPRGRGNALAFALDVHRALGVLDLPDVLPICRKPEGRGGHREYPAHRSLPFRSPYAQIL